MARFEQAGRPAVVGVVGPSGVGKTSLLERLVRALTDRGLAVAALKHASHGFLADHPGKDSFRLYESGAAAVAIISREQVATFARLGHNSAAEVSLEAALAALPGGVDLVLAEGFSWEPIPRLVLRDGTDEPARAHVESGQVLEIVDVPRRADQEPPEFPEALITSLVKMLAEHVEGGGSRRS